jgi:hypothetical protein
MSGHFYVEMCICGHYAQRYVINVVIINLYFLLDGRKESRPRKFVFLVRTVKEIRNVPTILRHRRNNACNGVRTRLTGVPEKLPSSHGDSLVISSHSVCLSTCELSCEYDVVVSTAVSFGRSPVRVSSGLPAALAFCVVSVPLKVMFM